MRLPTPALLALFSAATIGLAAPAPPPERGEALYRTTLVRAAPGRLVELVEVVRPRATAGALVLRHSQGDQWDLLVLQPLGSWAEAVASGRLAEPLAPEPLVAWQEDLVVRGPALDSLLAGEGRLYHVEMFLALPGKRAELVRQRERENDYLRALARPTNAIFVRETGAAWDAFTVGTYAGWKHYAAREDVPPEKDAAAAAVAGFGSSDAIGPYLRTLIQSHHDTLATRVR